MEKFIVIFCFVGPRLPTPYWGSVMMILWSCAGLELICNQFGTLAPSLHHTLLICRHFFKLHQPSQLRSPIIYVKSKGWGYYVILKEFIENFSEGLQRRQLFPNSVIIDKNVKSMTRKASNPSEWSWCHLCVTQTLLTHDNYQQSSGQMSVYLTFHYHLTLEIFDWSLMLSIQ